MQALHRKLDVVLVQILRNNCSETDYSFCEDSPPEDSVLYPDAGFTVRPFSPPTTIFFAAPPLRGGSDGSSQMTLGRTCSWIKQHKQHR